MDRKILALGVTWNSAETMIRVMVGFIAGIAVARYLQPENFGIFVQVLALVSLLNAFSGLGLEVPLINELKNKPSQQNMIIGTAISLRLLASLLLILPFLAAGIVQIGDTRTMVVYSSLLLFQPLSCLFLFRSYFLTIGEPQVPSIFLMGSVLSSFLLKLVGVYAKMPTEYFIATILIEWLALSGLYVNKITFSQITILVRSSSKSYAKKLLHTSLPLMWSSITFVLLLNVDKVILPQILDNESDFGRYAFASRISVLFHMIPGVLLISLFPTLNLAPDNVADIRKKLCIAFSGLGILALICAVVLFTKGDKIFSLLVGDEYRGSGGIAAALMLSNIFVSAFSCYSYFNVMRETTPRTLIINLVSLVAFVPLLIILASAYGVWGAPFALFVSYFFGFVSIFMFEK